MTKYHDIPYINLVKDVLAHGVKKTDRTGVGTISVFGRQMTFDLSDGTIPLLTTKKMHWPSIIHELLWYISGDTHTYQLEKGGVRIWREWTNEQGELGPVYGQMWRSWNNPTDPQPVVFVQPRPQVVPQYIKPRPAALTPITDDNDSFIGSIVTTKECGDAIVVSRDATNPKQDHSYTIQFVDTGYVKHNVRRSVCRRGHIIDRLLPRVNGVGYLGDYDTTDPNAKKLLTHWYKMLDRCYNKSTPEYTLYGGSGVTVDPTWACFAEFQHTVKKIPNWCHKRLDWSSYELDKDYYGSNVYGPQTCVWLHTTHNTLYRSNPMPFEVTSPRGVKTIMLSKAEAARRLGFKQSAISRVLSGKCKHHHGYTMKYVTVPDGCLARYAHPIDQLAQLVDGIIHNPDSRRLMVTAWNPSQLKDMALPPCHFEFQCWTEPVSLKDRVYEASKTFYMEDAMELSPSQLEATMDENNVPRTRLSMMLNMRSNDVGLGNPFNIAQYSILLRMLCEVTGCLPGKFIWTGGDTHIYTHNNPDLDPELNHVPKLQEQLTRPPFPSPKLSFARKITSIDDFKFEDFVLCDYQCHPGIKMKVAV